jgi:hypothetical protein
MGLLLTDLLFSFVKDVLFVGAISLNDWLPE